MSIQTHATFVADFPDDTKWGETGPPLIPGGKAVMSAVHDALTNLGILCTGILQRSFYGWEFDFNVGNEDFICVVQCYENDQWLLICEPRGPAWRRMFSRRGDDADTAAITKVHEVLTSDSRFSGIEWHHREQFEQGRSLGSLTPTAE